MGVEVVGSAAGGDGEGRAPPSAGAAWVSMAPASEGGKGARKRAGEERAEKHFATPTRKLRRRKARSMREGVAEGRAAAADASSQTARRVEKRSDEARGRRSIAVEAAGAGDGVDGGEKKRRG